jgi:hypothetical protein
MDGREHPQDVGKILIGALATGWLELPPPPPPPPQALNKTTTANELANLIMIYPLFLRSRARMVPARLDGALSVS